MADPKDKSVDKKSNGNQESDKKSDGVVTDKARAVVRRTVEHVRQAAERRKNLPN